MFGGGGWDDEEGEREGGTEVEHGAGIGVEDGVIGGGVSRRRMGTGRLSQSISGAVRKL